MIYPDRFEQKCGFDQIRRLIAEKCLSRLGEERVDEIAFDTDPEQIERLLRLTGEFMRILTGEEEFPVSHFFDIREPLKRIRIVGTFLSEAELFDLRRSLETIRAIVAFLRREADSPYPTLQELAGDVTLFPQLIGTIDRLLDKFGRIKDNASPDLQHIRREMSATTTGISKSLNAILRSAQSEGFVDREVTPTLRDGRLVIPVIPAYKRKIRGIVHDESASGKTVFIEPAQVVEANNRIRELEGEERREILRILTAFADEIRPSVPEILASFGFLAEIDFLRAKALFALETGGIAPQLSPETGLSWEGAVHPLLYLSLRKQQREVVPLDVTLEGDRRIVLISGPNAGGKSVCLKTVGLLQYMVQCGVPIPVREGSRSGVFRDIFIDIGDEQSIENDLSTYSSHLLNMKQFLRNCSEGSLLLIDEFGSGTEPQIGGAIAEALLDRFNRKGAFGVITTHYQNLKHFAEAHPGIVNGAMLYDRHRMQPLFQLSVGNPGSSFAVEIARKIGLPEEVIADASEKVGSDYIELDKYLQDIVRDKRYWENKRQAIRLKEKRMEETTARYETELKTLDKERKALLRQAREEAERLLGSANARIEATIRQIKEAQAEREKTRAVRSELQQFRSELAGDEATANDPIARKMEKLKAKEQRKQIQNERTEKPVAAPPVPGDAVRIAGQETVGEVLELQGKNVWVAFGMIKSLLPLSRVEKVSRNRLRKETEKSTFISERTADDMRDKQLQFKQEIDLRGMRGDEALQAVTYFIDDAQMLGISKVRILHGTGTGALRQLIREYLRSVPGVARFGDEHVQFGGAGITVVEF